jgi:hypothetical protein
MRNSLKSTVRRLSSVWFWPVVLLVLPNCTNDYERFTIMPSHLSPGDDLPHADAVMCQIEKFDGRKCADPTDDLSAFVRLPAAAIALTTGDQNATAVDDSMVALNVCGNQLPQLVTFEGTFPDGLAVCLDCDSASPSPYVDANAVCVAKCEDLLDNSEQHPPDNHAFCVANARVATNFPVNGCFLGACAADALVVGFADPRRTAEAVEWTDRIGCDPDASLAANDLKRSAATTGTTTDDFNAGAVSTQWFTHGDGYVEFEVGEATGFSRVAGLSEVPPGCQKPADCPDTDPHLPTIDFAIALQLDGNAYVFEHSDSPVPNGAQINFGAYTVGERYRVNVKDKQDGTNTAEISYSRVINPPCVPGNPCPDDVFYPSAGIAHYPLRVDTSFREQGGTLLNVRVVRIQ